MKVKICHTQRIFSGFIGVFIWYQWSKCFIRIFTSQVEIPAHRIQTSQSAELRNQTKVYDTLNAFYGSPYWVPHRNMSTFWWNLLPQVLEISTHDEPLRRYTRYIINSKMLRRCCYVDVTGKGGCVFIVEGSGSKADTGRIRWGKTASGKNANCTNE
jgi:hypothetical protein